MIEEENENEIDLLSRVKNMFNTYQLKECINEVNQNYLGKSQSCHEQLQLYKAISLFESDQQKLGIVWMEQIIEEGRNLRKDNVEEIDVIIRILYQLYLHHFEIQKAEENNPILKSLCEKYKSQNEQRKDYKEGVYSFGIGMYLYIETCRDQIDKNVSNYFEKALLSLVEYRGFILIILGWMYYLKRDYHAAISYYKQIYNENRQFPGVANNYALALQELNEDEQSEKLFLEAESQCSYSGMLFNNISLFYKKQKNNEKYKEYSEKIYALDTEDAIHCHLYGDYLYQNNQKEKAITLFEKGCQLDKDYIGNWYELYIVNIDSNNISEAQKYIQECIRIYPNDGQYYLLYGCTFIHQSDYTSTVLYCEKSLTLKNYFNYKLTAYYCLGYSHYRLDNFEQALECYLQSIGFNCSKDEIDYFTESCQSIKEILEDETFPLVTKERIIDAQQGYLFARFEELSNQIEHNEAIKFLLLNKLNLYREILSISVYRNYIEPLLNYQSHLQYWDLSIE